ncbi:MAG: DNA-3-methyladenine glycosylase I [Candidatus Baltobacteraceae bacterium]
MPVPTIPEQISPVRLGDYLEVMTRAVFQAGLSWQMIAERWDAFREGFCGFDVDRVATFDEGDIDRLMTMDGILHSSRKIRATVKNAQVMLELDRRPGGFAAYLRSFPGYTAFATDFRRRFKFMGEMNVWYFLFCVSEPVPKFESWVKTISGDHPRMREMVEQARKRPC